MQRSLYRTLRHLSLAAILAGAGAAQAAELGEPVVRSHIGQPLVADIELTTLAPDELTGLQVKLAHPDVYRAANVGMHPALASLHLSIMRRDRRQFLHITSIKPVDAEHVHLFLELVAGERRNVRAATLWLTPDPTPAPPAPVQASAPPAPAAHAEPEQDDTDAEIQALTAARARAAMNKPAQAARRSARTAGTCPQLYTADQIKACVALDYKNAALAAQIIELEEKVKALQATLETKPAVAAAPVVAAPSKVVKPLVKKAPPPPGLPWGWIGGAIGCVLALAGGGIYFLKRRKGAAGAESAQPGLFGGLMGRFKGKKAEVAEHAPEEPKLG